MTTQEIAAKLVDYCRQGNYSGAQDELYSEDAVSIEPEGTPAPIVQGLDAIREKSRQFAESVEQVHGGTVSDPQVAGNFFSCTLVMDVTFKQIGRVTMEEVCVYETRDGRIVKEQFFYNQNSGN